MWICAARLTPTYIYIIHSSMRGSTAGSNWDNQTALNDDDNVRVVVRCRPMNENERNRNDKQVLYVEESQTAVTLRAPGGGTYISVLKIILLSLKKKKTLF